MAERIISSMRDFIKSFQDEIITIEKEVDPICEIAGIQRALEDSYAVLFNNIKGYPGVRDIGNVFGRSDRMARVFNGDDPKKLKFKCLDAIKNPLPPRIVEDAPCQEVVITDKINVLAIIPNVKHSPRDASRLFGGGISFLSGADIGNAVDIAFRRMRFSGKDWGSIAIGIRTHLGKLLSAEIGGRTVPLTMNISCPPAINLVAATSFVHSVVPLGANEVAIAGRLQGSPIDIVKAKTVDAYAIANSEWVIEGYLNSSEEVWETEEAKSAWEKGIFSPAFPEWHGHLGRARKFLKFQVTAITHRKDRPIFYTPLARSYATDNMSSPFREACFYELADRLAPGFVTDVHILPGVASWNAYVAIQVKKREAADDALQREILAAYLAELPRLSLAIAVDEDVDIYSSQDLLWAMASRWDPAKGLVTMFRPGTKSSAFGGTRNEIDRTAIGIDATFPWGDRDHYERAHYPSDTIDLSKWISEEKIIASKQMQSEYAKVLAKTGH